MICGIFQFSSSSSCDLPESPIAMLSSWAYSRLAISLHMKVFLPVTSLLLPMIIKVKMRMMLLSRRFSVWTTPIAKYP